MEVPGCHCHPRHNPGRLGRDRFLLADGFELRFSLPASLLIISFCPFPLTDKSARGWGVGEKNQGDKFCSVSAACTISLPAYTTGLDLRGEYSLVAWPVVSAKGTTQPRSQKLGKAPRCPLQRAQSLPARSLLQICPPHQRHQFLEDPGVVFGGICHAPRPACTSSGFAVLTCEVA